MSFQYDPNDLENTVNQVRLLIGDTTSPPDLQDEEVQYFVDTYTTVGQSSVAAARALAVKFAKQVDRQVGDLRIASSQKFKHYNAVADTLAAQGQATDPVEIYVGGQSEAEAEADRLDLDLPQPKFTVGMNDLPGSNDATSNKPT